MSEAARGHLAMFAFSGIVAGSFSLGRLAAPHIAPEVFTAIRFAIAGAAVWGLAFATRVRVRGAFAAPWRYPLLAAVFVFYFVAMFEGLESAEAVSLSAVFTLTPAMSALFGLWLLRQGVRGRGALALLVGGAGALWVVFRADLSALAAFEVGRGEAIYFAGCVAHAFYTPLLARLSRGENALVANAAIHSAGAVLLAVWTAPQFAGIDWAGLPASVWVALFYTALPASALTLGLLRYGALRLPSAKVMAYTYLVPSWVLVWEAALGHGLPGWPVLTGVALTALALVTLLGAE